MNILNRSFDIERLEARRLLSFSPVATYPVNAIAAIAADFNKDTVQDLVLNNGHMLLGHGDGTFDSVGNSALSYSLMAVGDLDADGNLDMAVANDHDVSVLLGQEDGTFATANNFSVTSGDDLLYAVAVGDFDGDGKLDLSASSNIYSTPDNDSDPGSFRSSAHLLLGNGTGDFSAPNTTYLGFGRSLRAVAADFNGDGIDDFAIASPDYATVRVLLGDASGVLQGPTEFSTGAYTFSLAVADIDGDLDADLVAATAYDGVSVLLGNGAGGFSSARNYATGPNQVSVAMADIDGNNTLDIVTTSNSYDGTYTGQINVLRGRGDGTFRTATSQTLTVGAYASALASADFDGDDRPDVAITTFAAGGSDGHVSVLLNDGNWPTKTYTGPNGGNWSGASNWSPAGVPTDSDFVTIAGKTVSLGSNATVANLTLAGGATLTLQPNGNRVLRTSSSSISSDSRLNLNDNALIVDYGGASPVESIRAALQRGYANGAWNGTGINSSTAASNVGRGIGFAEASELFSSLPASFAGQSVDSTALLVRYTSRGDANLDHQVDVSDLGILATNWQQSHRIFAQGDFNYDGVVDIADLGLLATNWQTNIDAPLHSRSPGHALEPIKHDRLIGQFASELVTSGLDR